MDEKYSIVKIFRNDGKITTALVQGTYEEIEREVKIVLGDNSRVTIEEKFPGLLTPYKVRMVLELLKSDNLI